MGVLLIIAATFFAFALSSMVRNDALRLRRERLAVGRSGEERVGRVLDLCGGMDRLEDIVFGRDIKRAAQVDHLVRCAECLLLIEVKNWSGVLSGKRDDEIWHLKKSGGSKQVRRNPIAQSSRQAKVVAEVAGLKVPIQKLVVISGKATPASGQFPDGVVTMGDLKRIVRSLTTTPKKRDEALEFDLDLAWQRLVEHAFAPDAEARAERYVNQLERQYGDKPWVSWLIMAISMGALALTMTITVYLSHLGITHWP